MIHNSEIADKFNELADLLEIEDANPFRIRAYRNAARLISGLSKSATDIINEDGDLTQYKGIGDDLAEKIKEIVKTGKLKKLEKERKKSAEGLVELIKIPNLGPKRVKKIYQELGIENKKELLKAAEEGKIAELSGFGNKIQNEIIEQIESGKEEKRILIDQAEEIGESLLKYMKALDEVEQAALAGSYRRNKETIGDLDLVVTGKNPGKIIEYFVKYEDIVKTVSQGDTRSSVILRSGLNVDLRAVDNDCFGAALLYFTGSKDHNIALRKHANSRNMKVNEYGLYKGETRKAGKSEEQIYKALDCAYIPPELREGRGEIDAALENDLPDLIDLKDIVGDLHVHSEYSDGLDNIRKMAKAAKEKGYEYIAITDHSGRLKIAKGLDEKRLRKQIEEIDKLNDELSGIKILKSLEVEILEDGSLDLNDEILKKLDLTVCSIHSKFKLSRKEQTERVLTAMNNPYFNIFGHPTGRKLLSRSAYDINLKKVFKEAEKTNCFLELNANPQRLDLNDIYSKMAVDAGVKISIGSDAHNADALDDMIYGVKQARRGWLEKSDIINTLSLDKLIKTLKK